MNILGWIAMGLIAGLLARLVVKDDTRAGCIYTIVVGVLGALIGGALAQAAGTDGIDEFSLQSILVAFLGACLLLLVLQALAGYGRSSRRSRR
jgi:uncharacterized membrane protein YeaQ/YmgE (transglycosylase-associated protein family)